MPKNAIATGIVDAIISPDAMGERITALIRRPWERQAGEQLTPEATEVVDSADTGLKGITDKVARVSGIDFSEYKEATVNRRIERRMQVRDISRMKDYVELLSEDDDEADALRRELLIGVTRFFRDEAAFQELNKQVVEPLVRRTDTNDTLRVWAAEVSTGEEVYSLAILFLEAFAKYEHWPGLKIFATDVNQNHIDVASVGQYPGAAAAELSPERDPSSDADTPRVLRLSARPIPRANGAIFVLLGFEAGEAARSDSSDMGADEIPQTLEVGRETMARASGVATVFVDDELQLNRFSPEATRLFSLRKSDVGRRLDNFSHRLEYTRLMEDLQHTLDTGRMTERKVQSRDGEEYLVRMLPYETDRGYKGAVSTFVDITAFQDARRLQKVVDGLPEGLAVLDKGGTVSLTNPAWGRLSSTLSRLGVPLPTPGGDYLNELKNTDGGQEDDVIQGLLTGIRSVLEGQSPLLYIESDWFDRV